jgi:ATP-dependent DNA helicase DinG
MERVPWPRPTVLHAARRLAYGGSAYDDQVVKARLAQAFGRLIRRQGDRGVFVILSAAMPSRLLTAFPPDVRISRVPLDVAIDRVQAKLFGAGGISQPDSLGANDEDPDAISSCEDRAGLFNGS